MEPSCQKLRKSRTIAAFSHLECPFLWSVSQICFVFTSRMSIFVECLADLLRFHILKPHFCGVSRRIASLPVGQWNCESLRHSANHQPIISQSLSQSVGQ